MSIPVPRSPARFCGPCISPWSFNSFFSSEAHQIDGDPYQPGFHSGIPAELLPCLPRPDQALLGQSFSCILIPQVAASAHIDPPRAWRVYIDQDTRLQPRSQIVAIEPESESGGV
jgi:hypothetical protein